MNLIEVYYLLVLRNFFDFYKEIKNFNNLQAKCLAL